MMLKALRKYGLNFGAYKIALVYSIIFFCGVSIRGQAASVRVSSETTVESDRIELGKIAQISGSDDSADRMKKISLGYAPNIGMTREISREQILMAISAAGFVSSDFALSGSPKANIHRRGQVVPSDAIRAAIEKALADRFASTGVEAKILDIQMPPKTEVSIGSLDVRIGATDIRSMFERFSMPIEIRVDGKKERSFAVSVEIEAFADVFVAAKDLVANAPLVGTDVRLERRKIEKPITSYFRDPDTLRGLRLTRNISSGDPLTSDACIANIVVRVGDTVRAEARSGNIKIIIVGEARASGRIGDKIAIKNKTSGAILQAVILDEGLVKVVL